MARIIVRFYKAHISGKPFVAAALHQDTCLVALQWPLELLRPRQVENGWWEKFGTGDEARKAAMFHVRLNRTDAGSRVEENPDCCKEDG